MTHKNVHQASKRFWYNQSAIRVIASTLGILVGLAGIEHGFFEILQGNNIPDSMFIDAIGPKQRFWEYGTEYAMTIIPNFFITGILAMIIGLIVTIWAGMFVQKKYGAWVLFLLSIILWLVGGGFAPIFLTIVASITATRINKPLTWWQTHLPDKLKVFFARLWPASLIAYVMWFLLSVELAIFGYPLLWFFDATNTINILTNLSIIMLGLIVVSILAGIAHDIQKQLDV